MTTVQFMSTKHSAAFSVDNEVLDRLLTQATESLKSGRKTSSAYVNDLLKWALDNYKEADVVATHEESR